MDDKSFKRLAYYSKEKSFKKHFEQAHRCLIMHFRDHLQVDLIFHMVKSSAWCKEHRKRTGSALFSLCVKVPLDFFKTGDGSKRDAMKY